jgi:hypothetical protein
MYGYTWLYRLYIIIYGYIAIHGYIDFVWGYVGLRTWDFRVFVRFSF